MKRKIVLMAKSKKGDEGYCIAGIDVDSREWIRLNLRGNYSIPRHMFKYQDGEEPSLLDTFAIDVITKDNSELIQPENYLCRLESIERTHLSNPEIIEYRIAEDSRTEKLFYNEASSVESEWLLNYRGKHYSLIAIQPENLVFYRNGNRRITAYFEYNGVKYKNIRVTDLEFEDEWNESNRKSQYRPTGEYVLVISLALPYINEFMDKRKCYKLVASVINKADIQKKPKSISAGDILKIVYDGINPLTGELFNQKELEKDDTFISVIKDLYFRYAVAKTIKPDRAGAPWDSDEDASLKEEFLSGMSISELAELHERTKGAIESRLRRKGLIE